MQVLLSSVDSSIMFLAFNLFGVFMFFFVLSLFVCFFYL